MTDEEERAIRVVNLARSQGLFTDGETELDDTTGSYCEIVSEGDDNGAYVRAWVWVDFSDTDLDKETEEENGDE